MNALRPRNLWFAAILIAALLSWYFFTERNSSKVSKIFKQTDRLVSAGRIKTQLSELASEPHRAGSEANKRAGDRIIDRLQKAGYEVKTETLSFDLPHPVEMKLFLTTPEAREFSLHEKIFSEDPYSAIAEQEIPFLAYSPDADLEGEVIYANFGAPEDYNYLKKSGIGVAGKIALVRGRGICRSMKILAAERENVAALLIYPEIRDQGILKPSFPYGTHLNEWTAQRGSLVKYFLHPGDPVAAKNAGVETEPTIPALAITPEIALKLFSHLEGNPVPEDWQGWLQKPYRTGPGNTRVRMIVKSTREAKELRNITATIEGKSPDSQIIAGNHYDAWIYGASDPSSGTAVLLEAAEVLMQLKKKGWTPERSLTFAFWDGEEYGMLGSTAWFQNHPDSISKTAAYINIDTAYRANDLAAYISPGLRAIFDESLEGIQDPLSKHYLLDIRGEYGNPGFSSDMNPFTLFSGIPVAEIGFGRSYALYHSIYDNLTWLEKFGDPDAKYRRTLSAITIRYLYLLSDSSILPYNFAEIANFVKASINDWERNHKTKIEGYTAEIAALKKSLDSFNAAAKRYEIQKQSAGKNFLKKNEVNTLLRKIFAEFFSSSKGSLLSMPALNRGCSGEALPQIYEAFSSNDRTLIKNTFRELASAFQRATEFLQQVERMLQQ